MFRLLCAGFLAVCTLATAAPALAAGELVGTLTDFSGTILVRTGGEWGSVPYVGMNLYSGDKVITRDGTALVTFTDQSTLGLCANTYVFVQEWEKEWVLFRNPRGYCRRILMIYGKVNFNFLDDKSRLSTTLLTRCLALGFVGDPDSHMVTGNLSTDEKMKNYVLFDYGHKSFTLGAFYTGVAPDMPIEKVEKLKVFTKALDAANSAAEARKAAEAYADGLITAEDRDFLFAKARVQAAQEAQAMAAELVKYHPDYKVVLPEAEQWKKEADLALAEAEAARERALAAGAVDPDAPTPEAVEEEKTPEPGSPLEEDIAPAVEPEEEPEAVKEPASEAVTEPAPEAVTEPAPEAVTEPAPEAVTEPAPEAVTEPAPEAVTEPAPEA
ncbi:MAG: hypothetical protein KKA60_00965, partial [Proteobacteria bacterium]|nr:hypothetical protein [Pseudomonadota bacterium]